MVVDQHMYKMLARRMSYTHHVIQNLVANDADHFEALLASDTVNDHVTMNADEVFAIQDSVLVLSAQDYQYMVV